MRAASPNAHKTVPEPGRRQIAKPAGDSALGWSHPCGHSVPDLVTWPRLAQSDQSAITSPAYLRAVSAEQGLVLTFHLGTGTLLKARALVGWGRIYSELITSALDSPKVILPTTPSRLLLVLNFPRMRTRMASSDLHHRL